MSACCGFPSDAYVFFFIYCVPFAKVSLFLDFVAFPWLLYIIFHFAKVFMILHSVAFPWVLCLRGYVGFFFFFFPAMCFFNA